MITYCYIWEMPNKRKAVMIGKPTTIPSGQIHTTNDYLLLYAGNHEVAPEPEW